MTAACVPSLGLAAPGDIDATFATTTSGTVKVTAVQPDGGIVVGGSFSAVAGVTRNRLARVNPSGILDAGFDPNIAGGGSPSVSAVVIQPDRRILIGGSFTTVAGVTRNHLARLNPDGSLDAAFDPNAGGSFPSVRSIVLQPDGKILICGDFTTMGGVTRNRIARLNSNGTLDTGFNPNADYNVYSMALQEDGRIVIGGGFFSIGGITRFGIARLHEDGSVDTGFGANLNASSTVWCVAVQPDGMILVGGYFTTIGGQTRNRIGRLNSNGILDPGFNPNANDLVGCMTAQADGKIIIGGLFTSLGGVPRKCIARLNSDGTPDTGFNPDVTYPLSTPWMSTVSIQSNGQVVMGGNFSHVGGVARSFLARVENSAAVQSLSMPDSTTVQWLRGGAAPGTTQVSFELSTDNGATYSELEPGMQINGGWELAGLTLPASGQIRARALSISTNSSSWSDAAIAFGRPPAAEFVLEQPAGVNLADGGSRDFGAVNQGSSSSLVFTIRNTGETDLTGLGVTIDGVDSAMFSVTASPVAPVTGPSGGTMFTVRFAPTSTGSKSAALHVASNDADEGVFDLALAGSGVLSANADLAALALNYSTLTPAFAAAITSYSASVPFNNSTVTVTPTAAQAAAAISVNGVTVGSGAASSPVSLVVGMNVIGIHVAAQDGVGSRDYSIAVTRAAASAPGDAGLEFNPGVGFGVLTTALQPDGKSIVGGTFTSVRGVARRRLARLHADGTLDMSFDPNANSFVDSVLVLGDGRILVAGFFTTVGGVTRNRIARLNPDGSLDGGFDPDVNDGIQSVALQPDGKLVIGGRFTTVGGVARNGVARLNADGTLDGGFNPNVTGSSFLDVNGIALQTDGKIIIGGNITSVGGVARSNLARLNADGTLDAGYNPGNPGTIAAVTMQPDGKLLVGGSFLSLGGASRNRIARLNPDASADPAFDPNANNIVYHISLQSDGRILLCGSFTTVGGVLRNRMARLLPDGSLDAGFNPNASGIVRSASIQADGKIVIGGEFTTVAGLARAFCARLENNAITDSLTTSDTTRIEWLRGGAVPEAVAVSFDLSTDGGMAWSPLGAGARISGGWELTGLSLPASFQARARARVVSGSGSASSGLVETIREFPQTALGTWRQSFFGSPANAGDGADGSDSDRDGLVNLLEYAFDLNPTRAASSAIPGWTRSAGDLVASFVQPPGVSGIVYGAEWSTGLSSNPASWTPIPDTGTAGQHVFALPVSGEPKVFVRFTVTKP